jgi:serine/threonine-protein kinase
MGTGRLGSRVGRWTLVRVIGEGGTASVFEGRRRDGARAAVKILSRDLASDSELGARFLREARIVSSLDHPGVVRVLDEGRTKDGLPYLAMELLDGETLEERRVRKGGRLAVSEVLWAADGALSVLAAAHARGIVHRDVKPENLFLTRKGRIKLLDFGIARLADGGSQPRTSAGLVLGTLAYMAPEQARGEVDEIGVASDVWGVGATMFVLLSGRVVRDDFSVKGLLEAGTQAVVPLASVAPDVAVAVASVVDAALSFDPQVRWPSAAAMRVALHAAHAEWQHLEKKAAGATSDAMPVSRSGSLEEIRVHSSILPPRISDRPPPGSLRRPRGATRRRRSALLALGVAMLATLALAAVLARWLR